MEDFQQRVVTEHAELLDRLNKLRVFFNADLFNTLDDEEQERLLIQEQAMTIYERILNLRIKHFT